MQPTASLVNPFVAVGGETGGLMSPLAPFPPPAGPPATLEDRVSFRVRTAALSRPAEPTRGYPNMVLTTDAEGGVIVHTPSEKLVILAGRRRAPANKAGRL